MTQGSPSGRGTPGLDEVHAGLIGMISTACWFIIMVCNIVAGLTAAISQSFKFGNSL